MDPRVTKLAETLVNYSLKIKEGDTIQINGTYEARTLILECYRLILEKGAYPKTNIMLPDQSYIFYKSVSEKLLKKMPKVALFSAKNTDGVINIVSAQNTRELSNVDPKKMSIRSTALRPLTDIRLKKDNWVICGFPTLAAAQEADMSLGEFEDYVYSATNINWEEESKKQEKLKQVLDNGTDVRIIGKETDITFSINNMCGIKCNGHRNMPDGEVFTAPIPKSVNGKIYYEYPAIYRGRVVSGIRLEFKNGKVVKASAEKNEEYLKEMIKLDKGASYIGEFGIGVNFQLNKFIKSILFDEKLGGTIHLALGRAYPECGKGGNKSALHWDMIKDLKNGRFLIDGKVILKNGKFLI
ncbi:aminopeptidase [archaeon]|jgi:aminopeptidase|nr:aminopeptidase [archaeon]MBT4397479.1 aminopeptidase [archaeon]MBT4440874.1 aminopeptidase [archaeon]